MKKLAGLASGLFLALGMLVMNSALVHADYDVSNDSAAMVVRIRLNVDRGVTITTGVAATMDLGFVSPGNSTGTVLPATVTVTGNLLNTELNLSALITGGWVFDNTQTITSTAGSTNVLHAWAQFTSVSTGLAPTQSNEYFRVGATSGTKIIPTDTGPSFAGVPVGIAGGSGIGRFENNEGGSGDMDSMNPVSVRHMFTYFTLPPSTSLTADQDINFVLSVRTGP
jgi:hypothetical protein